MIKKLLLSMAVLTGVLGQLQAQDRSLSGRITAAEDGSPLPGANIAVKGTNQGTTADANGAYRLSVSNGATLVISSIGYVRQEVTVGNRNTLDVSLTVEAGSLNEVVVVGYGTQRRSSLTGAQGGVRGDQIATIPVQTLDRALQGQVAGVQVTGANGTPGGQVQVRIRGVGSITGGTDPLYVVDGVQLNTTSNSAFASTNPLAFLNPNDIESIEILKDAAAAAIYGAAASNGVVLITTKRGKSGQTRITLDTYTGYVEPIRYLDVLNTQEFIQVRTEAVRNQNPALTQAAALSSVLGAIRLATDLSPEAIAALPTYDWQRESYKKGVNTYASLALEGGNEKTSFRLSGSFSKADANVRNVGLTSGNLAARITNKVNNRLTIENGLNLSSFNQKGQFGGPAGGSFLGSPTFSSPLVLPLNPIYKDNGDYYGYPGDTPSGLAGILNQNVILVSDLNKINSRTNQLVGSLNATYKITEQLSFRPFASLDYRTVKGENFSDPRTADAFNVRGRVSLQDFERINFLTNAVLGYDRAINETHNISALVGVEFRSDALTNVQLTAENVPTPDFSTAASAANPITTNSSKNNFRKAGLFGRLNYNYKEKYLVGLTARYDGSSRFGANNQFGFFPGISLAYDVAKEDFLKNNQALSQLKLRASYGALGNDQIGNFDSRGLYNAGFNYNAISGIAPAQLSNPDLRWERNITVNFGLDYGLFNGRIQGSVDYFIRDSKDLLLDQPVVWTNGYGSITRNVGAVQNKGLEVDITTTNFNTGGFKWTTNFNFAYIQNKVTKLYDTLTVLPGRASDEQIRIGQPINSIYTAQYAGVNPATGRAMWYDNAGNIIYRLAGNIDSYSRIIGSQIPKWTGGFRNSFSYKGIELEALFTYEFGRTAFNNQTAFMAENGGRLFNGLQNLYDERWTTPGQVTHVPRPINGNAETLGSAITSGSRFYEDASYIRLKNVTLAYNLPESLVRRVKLSRVRVYAQAYNLITWTKWTGFDPEFFSLGQGNNGVVPQTRNVTFGLTLGL